MNKDMYCVECALAIAEGRRNPLAGHVKLVSGACPECGSDRGLFDDADSSDDNASASKWLALRALALT